MGFIFAAATVLMLLGITALVGAVVARLRHDTAWPWAVAGLCCLYFSIHLFNYITGGF